MVIGVNHGQALLLDQIISHLGPLVALAVVQDHLSPIASGGGQFAGRGIAGHGNGRRNSQQLGGQSNTLGVIAGRMRNYPTCFFALA